MALPVPSYCIPLCTGTESVSKGYLGTSAKLNLFWLASWLAHWLAQWVTPHSTSQRVLPDNMHHSMHGDPRRAGALRAPIVDETPR